MAAPSVEHRIVPGSKPFDAVMVAAFGGPTCPEDVRPFLENVVRGKQVPSDRLDEVAGHYAMFGGVSPLSAITHRQADGLAQRLKHAGLNLPVYVGMRHWHPYLRDTLQRMAEDGVRRLLVFIANPHHSEVSCTEYKRDIQQARRRLVEQGMPDIAINYVDSWYDHKDYIGASAQCVRAALEQLEPSVRPRARLIFSAHSLPVAMAERCRYAQQGRTTARLVAENLQWKDWAVAYQSRSGPPRQPWLEPDVCDDLKRESKHGMRAAVLVPLGFITDHVEVLYDLHHVAGSLCRELRLPVALAHAVNDHPVFLDMMADVVTAACKRFGRYPPLPITRQNA